MELKYQRGFTLLELMIVVAIIAILAGILIPNFSHARAQAQTAACESNLREIATALELYYADVQSYPSSAAQVYGEDGTHTPTIKAGSTIYLNTTPEDPAALNSTAAYYSLSVTGASGATPASYTITCPGIHEPSTLQKITPGTSHTTLNYSSGSGLGTQ